MQKRVFISYNRASSGMLANLIVSRLAEHQIEAFIDTRDLTDLGPMGYLLQKEIDRADVFVCLLGETTLASGWVNLEIEYAFAQKRLMLPVFQEGYQSPPPPLSEAVPFLLNCNGVNIFDRRALFIEGAINRLAYMLNGSRTVEARTTSFASNEQLKALIVDDDKRWRDGIARHLQTLPLPFEVDYATSFEEGLTKVSHNTYDLVTMDLVLREGSTSERGMELAHRLRSTPQNVHAGLIIISGYPSIKNIQTLMQRYKADCFIEKRTFEREEPLVSIVRRTIRDARLRWAQHNNRVQYQLRLQFNNKQIDMVAVNGTAYRTQRQLHPPLPLSIQPFQTRNKHLVALEKVDPSLALAEGQQIGTDLFKAVMEHPLIYGTFVEVRTLAQGHPWLLEIQGSTELLDIPFELLRQETRSLADRCLIFRSLQDVSIREFKSFEQLVSGLVAQYQPLNIVLVGDHEETNDLSHLIHLNLDALSIPHRIIVLSDESQPNALDEQLSNTDIHVLHFSRWTNASRFLEIFANSTFHRPPCLLFANQSLVDTNGSIQVALERIAGLQIPTIMSYHWNPSPDYMRAFALEFYSQLWTTFDMNEAFFETRRQISSRMAPSLIAFSPLLISSL